MTGDVFVIAPTIRDVFVIGNAGSGDVLVVQDTKQPAIVIDLPVAFAGVKGDKGDAGKDGAGIDDFEGDLLAYYLMGKL